VTDPLRPARAGAGRFLVAAVLVVTVAGAITSGRDTAFPIRGVAAVLGVLVVVEALRWWAVSAAVDDRRVRPLTAPERPAPAGPRRPAGLVEWEGIVEAAGTNGRAARVRLGPRYRELARLRLALVDGIDLDADPDRAAARLGPDGWALASKPAGPLPGPNEPGLSLDVIERAVDALDRG
jgi:hypothetical protein